MSSTSFYKAAGCGPESVPQIAHLLSGSYSRFSLDLPCQCKYIELQLAAAARFNPVGVGFWSLGFGLCSRYLQRSVEMFIMPSRKRQTLDCMSVCHFPWLHSLTQIHEHTYMATFFTHKLRHLHCAKVVRWGLLVWDCTKVQCAEKLKNWMT